MEEHGTKRMSLYESQKVHIVVVNARELYGEKVTKYSDV